ncbi:hypothetical protein, partial [Silvanigrella sp.]|uniref:hypothetical protein n=1 Tax=Silvanigrella sp. TaxID=2024976 RepID=UPI0037C7DDBF
IKKAIALYQNTDYIIELARNHLELQKYDEALEQINHILTIDPNHTIAINLKSQCMQSKENFITNPISGKDMESKLLA